MTHSCHWIFTESFHKTGYDVLYTGYGKERMYPFTHFHFLFNHQLFIVNTHPSKIFFLFFFYFRRNAKNSHLIFTWWSSEFWTSIPNLSALNVTLGWFQVCSKLWWRCQQQQKKSRKMKGFFRGKPHWISSKVCIWGWEKGNRLQTEDINLAPLLSCCILFIFLFIISVDNLVRLHSTGRTRIRPKC